LGAGVWSSALEVAEAWRADRRFDAEGDRAGLDAEHDRWRRAVERSLDWVEPDRGNG
jgi:glycerol kinase